MQMLRLSLQAGTLLSREAVTAFEAARSFASCKKFGFRSVILPPPGSSSHASRAETHSGSSRTSLTSAMPVVYHPSYSPDVLPAGHRFPMQVFERIYQRLLEHALINTAQVVVPNSLPSDATLQLVHKHSYLEAFNSGTLDEFRTRRIGFGAAVQKPQLIERTKAEVAGTLLTARLALQHGLACNTAGGVTPLHARTHHAYPDFGSGFCILNDLAVTTEVLLKEGLVQRVLILDLDVHQGDGTAYVFRDRPDVFTLSVHCQSNFPAKKQQSTLDVPLPDGVDDAKYLNMLGEVLPSVLTSFRPDLVLYDAGVDIHVHDALGRLNITDEGLMRRELLVLDTCLGYGVPVAGVVGGGYNSDLDVLAERHMCLHRAALQMWQDHGL